MNVYEAIKERRSIRRFLKEGIDETSLKMLLEAVRWSPSWANSQCWEVIVVTRPELKEKIASLLSPRNPAKDAIREAPVIFVMCARKGLSGHKAGRPVTDKGDWWYMFDVGLATQNLCLLAHSIGLGSVIVGNFDHKGVTSLLGVPEGVDVVALIPVGKPAEKPSPPLRKEIREFAHAETWDREFEI